MSRPHLTVLRSRTTLLGSEIIVKAHGRNRATFGSFLGDRVFGLDDGERLRIKVKGKMWERGDRLTLSQLVGAARNWSNVPWGWA